MSLSGIWVIDWDRIFRWVELDVDCDLIYVVFDN